MAIRRRLFAGQKLREIRANSALEQKEMARKLAISPSYLSQLEHDGRPLTPRLVERLATLFPVAWQDFDTDETERITIALREALSDPMFSDSISPDALVKLAEQQPVFSKRFIELHAQYRRTSLRLEMVDDSISEESSSVLRLPWEEIRDWFHIADNYVDPIDRAAENLFQSLIDKNGRLSGTALRGHLRDEHGVEVILGSAGSIRKFDLTENTLHLDATLPPSGLRFQLAYHIAVMTLRPAIAQVAEGAELKSQAARELLKVGLANYGAGAILMPYELFRQAARQERHDVDRLSLLFGASFEQVCHRLSTLQRERAKGTPVFFCRVDMAGNITKRHSATRLQFARFGGACPLWIVHEAVAIPDRVQVQLAETPDGVRYVSMAKGLVKASGSFDRNPRRYAVALGCEATHAGDFVYADRLDLRSKDQVTPIGSSCRICPRTNCDQRAYPPSDHAIKVDLFERGVVPYSLEKDG